MQCENLSTALHGINSTVHCVHIPPQSYCCGNSHRLTHARRTNLTVCAFPCYYWQHRSCGSFFMQTLLLAVVPLVHFRTQLQSKSTPIVLQSISDRNEQCSSNKSSHSTPHTSERIGTTVAQTDVMSKAITINYHLSTPLGYTFRVGLFRAPEGTSPSPCVRKDSDTECMSRG